MFNKAPHLVILAIIWTSVEILHVSNDVLHVILSKSLFARLTGFENMLVTFTVALTVLRTIPKIAAIVLAIYSGLATSADHLCRRAKNWLAQLMWVLLERWDSGDP